MTVLTIDHFAQVYAAIDATRQRMKSARRAHADGPAMVGTARKSAPLPTLRVPIPPQIALGRLVPPISSSYSGCKLVKELEIEKRH